MDILEEVWGGKGLKEEKMGVEMCIDRVRKRGRGEGRRKSNNTHKKKFDGKKQEGKLNWGATRAVAGTPGVVSGYQDQATPK